MTDTSTDLHHFALIPDGNRRWAKAHKVPSLEGHRQGFKRITEIARHLRKRHISTFTTWGFSTENWGRPESEISYLMDLILDANSFINEFIKDKVRVTHLGRKDRLPKKVIEMITKIEESTKKYNQYYLNIALDYGGQDEIIRAINKHHIKYPGMSCTNETFETCLDTAGQPYSHPDLIVRTGGEKRLSGFFSWAASYSELAFIDTLLPDITNTMIDNLIYDYNTRQRRFGK